MTQSTATKPDVLTREEAGRLHRWQRRVIQVFSSAIFAFALALAVQFAFGDARAFASVLLALGVGLLAATVMLQFARRCPRCGATLGVQALPILPDRCKRCGVAIPRPPMLDEELDN